MKTAKAISFKPEVLKAKLRALEEHGTCQTRRPLKHDAAFGVPVSDPEWTHASGNTWTGCDDDGTTIFSKSAYASGDIIWVRERALVVGAYGSAEDDSVRAVALRYELGGEERAVPWPARLRDPVEGHCIPNGVHREGARHFLEVVEVRAERVADISEHDAILEGVDRDVYEAGGLVPKGFYRAGFLLLYDSIYGAGAHARDWCWVYTLKRATP